MDRNGVNRRSGPREAPGFRPAYLGLAPGELAERARRAVAGLADCRACPRDCRVNRLEDRWSACMTGRHAVVASWFPHFGEEDCLRGWNGSGTIFFAHCNLRCVFCQNHDISQDLPARTTGHRPDQIARMMLELQALGCHNINLVTPEHVVPQVLEALVVAVDMGLTLPIVYNTGAYDSLESLALLDGVVDIYMPDFKCWSPDRSKTYLRAADYGAVARAAIRAMHEQVGPLIVDSDGLATRGVLLRHLVMPGWLDETQGILEWVARELGPDTYVNLMDQYAPAAKVDGARYPELNRRIRPAELEAVGQIAHDLGLRRLDERRALPLRRSPRH